MDDFLKSRILPSAAFLLLLIMFNGWQNMHDITGYEILPRDADYIAGIVTAHFLHNDDAHLWGNMAALVPFCLALAAIEPRTAAALVALIVGSGLTNWLFGVSGPAIGASVMVFAVFGYVVAYAISGRAEAILAAAALLWFDGGRFMDSVVPNGDPTVAWDGHLIGLLTGLAMGYLRATHPRLRTA